MEAERILVVDDETNVVAACRKALKREGYTTEGVTDAEEAMRRLREEHFDLMLTDIRLADQNGLDLLAAAKKLDPHIAVVVITGYGTMDDAIRAIHLGAEGFLLKPFDPGELVTIAQESLHRRALLRDSLRLQILMPLLKINEALRSKEGLTPLARQVLSVVREETKASRLWLMLRENVSFPPSLVASVPEEPLQESMLEPAMWERVMAGDGPAWIDAKGEHFGDLADARRPVAISLPLISINGVIGMLNAEKEKGLPPFSTISVDLLSLLGGQLAIAAENFYLHRRQKALSAFNQNIIENMTNGLIVVDAEGKMTVFNKSAAILTGYEPEEMLGYELEAALPHAGELVTVFNQVLESGEMNLHHEITLRHWDGSNLPVAVSATPLRGEEGEIEGAIGLLEDLSEARIMEAERMRLDRLAALGQMSAVIAHEIRNPIAGIAAGVEYLSARFEEGSPQAEGAQMMLKETRRVNRILEDILSIARPFQLQMGRADLEEICRDVLLGQHPTIEAKKLTVKEFYSPEVEPILADADRLRQVISNLVLNSVEAMKEGGELSISVMLDGAEALLEVRDTGSGIPPEVIKRIFEPFFTTKSKGTGLGLSVSSRIVEEHGGKIDVHSEVGIGAAFTVRLAYRPYRENGEAGR